MEDTNWDNYGTGNYEKCADCMVHSGFEASAVTDSFRKPWKLLGLLTKGIRTSGPMAPEISLTDQRPAEFVFSRHVQTRLVEIEERESRPQELTAAE